MSDLLLLAEIREFPPRDLETVPLSDVVVASAAEFRDDHPSRTGRERHRAGLELSARRDLVERMMNNAWVTSLAIRPLTCRFGWCCVRP